MLIGQRAALETLSALLFLCGVQTAGQTPEQTPEKSSANQKAQPSQPGPQKRPRITQSVVVTAKATPEQEEEGKLNDVYESVRESEDHECSRAVEKYRSLVIPLAEQAKFTVPRNKYLFLSYRGIGECEMAASRFAEAEKTFQTILQYAPVWPGINDSDYPINYYFIGLSRMGQQNWTGAEEALQKAVSIFDQQIDRAVHSDSDWMRTEHATHLRASQDSALNLLGVVYFREHRTAEALATLDRAYNQATKYAAPAAIIHRIVQSGVQISVITGDSAAIALWSQRAKASN